MRRDEQIRIRATAEEKREFEDMAEAAGLAPSAFFRRVLGIMAGRISLDYEARLVASPPSTNGASPRCSQTLSNGSQCANHVALDKAGNPYRRCLTSHLEREEAKANQAKEIVF